MGSRDDGPWGDSWTVRDRRDARSSRASAPLFSPGDVVLERYELGDILGRGGMGVVFRAYDRVLDQEIAIKIVRAEYAGDRVWAQRLAREVRLARQINHPNVCRVFDVGQAEEHPFLTMELARRGTLRDEIAAGQAGPAERRLADAKMIASGLAAIHGAGIVHRDLAPQNVLRIDDGSLVVSDFGLATDRTEGASSVQGGTPAYMAPEVIRGAGASTASDIWSLGIVIHECVFGVRPTWAVNGQDVVRPVLGRALSDVERRAFDICRECLRMPIHERPRSAEQVADALAKGARLPAPRRYRRARSVIAVAGLFGIVALAGVTALMRNLIRDRSNASVAPVAANVPSVSGTAQDWTNKAKILATVPEQIRCMTLLPDRRTVRFVWGTPPRAEDLDTVSGLRVPSPLVPAAYAEGCPEVTRDGSKIVFAGHDRDLRPAAFVSTHLDGGDAVPVVSTGEPTLSTDPSWLPDNQSFLYTVDVNHSAVFSMTNRTSVVVPADTHLTFTTGYQVVGDAIFVNTMLAGNRSELRRLHFPHFDQDLQFAFAGNVEDVATRDGQVHYLAGMFGYPENDLLVADSLTHTIRRAGFIPERHLRHPVAAAAGLAFVSMESHPILVVTLPTGAERRFELPPDVWEVSPCGENLVATRGLDWTTHLVRLDWSGRQLGRLPIGRSPRAARCSNDGHVLYYQERLDQSALMRCENSRCEPIYRGWLVNFRLSPAGDRIVILTVGDDGMSALWVRADGQGTAHDIAKTDVPCTPGWSSEKTVWVAFRHGAKIVWRELFADTGTPTGTTAPGSYDCLDSADDPKSPVPQTTRVEWSRSAEIRLMPWNDLPGESSGQSP